MAMSQRLVGFLALSCVLAFGGAVWAYMAGFGLLIAFLIYSFGGSFLLLGFSALAVALEGLPEQVSFSGSELEA